MSDFIVDTRNQDDSFVVKALEDLGFTCVRRQLYFGDIAHTSNIMNCIDLKSSSGGLIELAKNICSKDHARLKREIQKCIDYKGQLTFLCFEPNITCIEDIANWKVPRFKSDQYKTILYTKATNKPVSKAKIKQAFDRRLKANKIILNGSYEHGLMTFTENNTYTKREISHRKGDKMTQVLPITLMKAIKTMSEPNHYADGVTINFEFTTKQDCGNKIKEIFNL